MYLLRKVQGTSQSVIFVNAVNGLIFYLSFICSFFFFFFVLWGRGGGNNQTQICIYRTASALYVVLLLLCLYFHFVVGDN